MESQNIIQEYLSRRQAERVNLRARDDVQVSRVPGRHSKHRRTISLDGEPKLDFVVMQRANRLGSAAPDVMELVSEADQAEAAPAGPSSSRSRKAFDNRALLFASIMERASDKETPFASSAPPQSVNFLRAALTRSAQLPASTPTSAPPDDSILAGVPRRAPSTLDPTAREDQGSMAPASSLPTIHDGDSNFSVVPVGLEAAETPEDAVSLARQVYLDAKRLGSALERVTSGSRGIPLFTMTSSDFKQPEYAQPLGVSRLHGSAAGSGMYVQSGVPSPRRGKHERVQALRDRQGMGPVGNPSAMGPRVTRHSEPAMQNHEAIIKQIRSAAGQKDWN